ncbi:MAG: cytochrome P450 [Hellea sp.]
MNLVSDNILIDDGKQMPSFDMAYPMLKGFALGNPNAWTKGQPHDYYKRMREDAPVMWSSMRKGISGFWSVSRYDDIKAVELAPKTFSSERGSMLLAVSPRSKWPGDKLVPASFNCLINLDAPRHMELRIQQKDFFIPAYVAKVQERVAAKIDALLDNAERLGPEVDFVKVFSQEVPMYTLCEMLGVDEADRPKILYWMHHLELAEKFIANPLRMLLKNPFFPKRFAKAIKDMFEYGEAVMADRRANPREDLLTVIAQSQLGGEDLPQEYLDGSWLLIIFAGNDTSRNSLSGTIRLLTQFEDQRQMVISNPALIPKMSQEALRLVSPVQYMRRTAMEDTEISGQKIAKDEKVVMWYGAANRDPSIFPNPDKFDMMRPNVDKHLAFGHGVHKCLGSRIAQMQLKLSYEKILERFPNIHWTGKQTIAPTILVHAVSSLKVNLYGPNGKRPTQVQVGSQD